MKPKSKISAVASFVEIAQLERSGCDLVPDPVGTLITERPAQGGRGKGDEGLTKAV